MSFHEEINLRRDTANAIFHKFRTAIKPGDDLHLFVEGYDDVSLYDKLLSDLHGLLGPRWHTHICFGKANMDKISDLLSKSALADKNVLFIRDSDFDRFLEQVSASERIFLTCGYSVENYVCALENISKFIRSNFGVDTSEVDTDELSARHGKLIGEIFEWMSPTVGAALYAVRKGEKLDLCQLKVSDLYREIYAGRPLPKSFPADQLEKSGLREEHFNEDSSELGTRFTNLDAMTWLRGKYLIECTALFLSFERDRLSKAYKEKKISRFNRRTSSDYSSPAVFERLCSTAAGTDDLRAALSKGLKMAA